MKKTIFLFTFFFFFFPSESPALRSVYSLNDAWFFIQSPVALTAHPTIDADQWKKINIPHTYNAKDGYIKKDYFRGTCTYVKEFFMPDSTASMSHYLYFEGVQSYAKVYLNGNYIGEHKGGYTGFGFDISSQIHFGKKNCLVVLVNNENADIAPLHGDFTIWGGIYRDVTLTSTDRTHFCNGNYGDSGIMIRTPVVNEKSAQIYLSAMIANAETVCKKPLLRTIIRNQSGRIVASQEIKSVFKACETKTIVFDKLMVTTPHLWSPDLPYLYTAEIFIINAKTGETIDKVTNNVGFRWYKFDAEKGFFLNGKHLKLIGVSRHQDFEELGAALTDEFHRKDVKLMKDMGVNFLRVAHYPQDNALISECDRLGILVWEEIPMVDIISFTKEFYNNCETNLKEMILQHYNHPCVVTWGFMNEIYLWVNKTIPFDKREPYYTKTVEIAYKLDSVVHAIDPTRLTTIAMHIDDAYEKSGLSKITDLTGWNVYKGWYGDKFEDFCTFIDSKHAAFPKQTLFISEYGAGSDRRIHTTKGHSFDYSIEYQQQFHEAYLPYILARDYISGSAVWNMNDFGSAERDESMPRINNKGLCYYNREPKDVYFYYQAMLNQKPAVHIATHDWMVRTALATNDSVLISYQSVKIYSNQKTVELFVNGLSLGSKEMQNCTAIWYVPFSNGKTTLVAKASKNGVIIEDVASVDFNILPSSLLNFKEGYLFEIALNCGSNCDFTDDKSGMTWLADRPYRKGSFGYVGGEIYMSKPWVIGFIDQIQGTRNGPMFQTFRFGATSYKFDVPNGDYEVELSFSEPKTENQKIIPTENIFDVIINNETVLPAWNISRNGGQLFAITKKLRTQVTDNVIKIELNSLKGMTLISGIKICKVL